MENSSLKTCSSCLKAKYLSDYHKDKKSKDGLCYICKLCAKQRTKIWCSANSERSSETKRNFYLKNRDRIISERKSKPKKLRTLKSPEEKERTKLEYRKTNKIRLLREKREWYEKNRERICADTRAKRAKDSTSHRLSVKNRKARLRGSLGKLSIKEWQDILLEFNSSCAYCLDSKSPLTMDHVRPISKGGMHNVCNIVPACVSCNSSKSDRMLVFWMYHFNERIKIDT